MTRAPLPELTLRPWILAAPPQLERLTQRCPLPDVLAVDVFEASASPFFELVNAGNALAYAGLGMPAWVQLDCCTLPSAMIGFAARADDLPEALIEALRARRGEPWPEWIPISEYCALPRLEQPGAFLGLSLFTLLPGRGLGLRTKALALQILRARTLMGVAQYRNASLRTHTALGPCAIAQAEIPTHTAPDTFAYTLEVPDAEVLMRLVDGGYGAAVAPPDEVHHLPLTGEGGDAARVRALMERRGPLRLVWPGLHLDEERGLSLCWSAAPGGSPDSGPLVALER